MFPNLVPIIFASKMSPLWNEVEGFWQFQAYCRLWRGFRSRGCYSLRIKGLKVKGAACRVRGLKVLSGSVSKLWPSLFGVFPCLKESS